MTITITLRNGKTIDMIVDPRHVLVWKKAQLLDIKKYH